jgi:hypothetical protein
MSLFRRLTNLFTSDAQSPSLWATYGPSGIDFRAAVEAPSEASRPVSSPLAIHYLNDLATSGIAEEGEDAFFLDWAHFYELAADPAQTPGLGALGLPSTRAISPALRAEGTLADPDFMVAIDGWSEDGRSVGAVELLGAVAVRDGQDVLLPSAVFKLRNALLALMRTPNRDLKVNREHWGRIRLLGLEAGAQMDQFLTFTVVLTPERLHLHLNQVEVADTGVVEIQPWFAGAPDNWLDEFDRRSAVPDAYEFTDGEFVTQVVVTPKVKKVLQAIKSMPGRRAAGAFAESFLSNPYATLGEAAQDVIDEEQFEQARAEAGLVFHQFTARCQVQDNQVIEAAVLVDILDPEAPRSTLEKFSEPEELQRFVRKVQEKRRVGLELCEWRGYRLQLLGETDAELAVLAEVYRLWTRPRVQITEGEVFDLKRYSERVVGIGVQPAIISPHIPKPDSDPWFPVDEAPEGTVLCTVDLDDGRQFQLAVDKKVYDTLKAAVAKAQGAGKSFVEIPGASDTVSVDKANALLKELKHRFEFTGDSGGDGDAGTGKKGEGEKKAKTEREELLIRTNVGSTEYRESRAEELAFSTATPPRSPSSLKPGVYLKDHQKVGVAWMQHLLSKAPSYCRGAVLADDMGLGKTLQLLTVIARALEEDPAMPPVLVVAPVSLLENWKEEVDRFFLPGALPLMTLYGDALAGLRAKTPEIDELLLNRGFTRFLRPDWLGNAKLVLTTYETLRDLEFSLAAVKWSIMVCDEAQKIKNPAAMVTRSAKKQNVGFKIACTGTPVENSLADLWCLFDFIQPGLLGALNEFGDAYRRPIECETDEQKAKVEELRALIEPQVLRRLKVDVAKDLPQKVVVDAARSLKMSRYQRELYSKALELYRSRRDPNSVSPFKNQLGLLHYLRKVCTDPRDIGRIFAEEPLEEARSRSPKLHWLVDTLEAVRQRGEKAIVFCEFRDMQLMLAYYLEAIFGARPDIINGDTAASATSDASRQKRIKRFQQAQGFGVIILSPVAVGFGVNIQAANHVIHFTRTWNPAKEDQATDRAYRIGQQKDVYVYYPVVRADEFTTFDVKLDALLERKRALSGDMLNGTGDLRPDEFGDVVDVDDDVFDEQILIDDADSLAPQYFEALVAALARKRQFKYVRLTPASGDGGVDVVAKTGTSGELLQVKTARAEDASLSWDAVKDVVAGEKLYAHEYPGVRFEKVAVTNRRFNEKARLQAQVNGVRLLEREELSALLREHRIVHADLDRFLSGTGVVIG